MRLNLYASVAVAALAFWIVSTSAAQTDSFSSAEPWKQRQKLEQLFEQSIKELAEWCKANELESAVDQLKKFVVERHDQRQYIFLPPENPIADDCLPDEWPEKLRDQAREVLQDHGEQLFGLARRSVVAGHGATAIQLMHEALFFDPNHREVRRILGHREIEVDGVPTWRVSKDRLRFKPAKKSHDEFDWQADAWLIAETPHFLIESRATKEQTGILARKLERWHDVWRQVFFDYYNRSINLQRWIDGKGAQRTSPRKFKVVFFADRDDYVAALSPIVPGIEASTGFYSDQQKKSYFFASDNASTHDTWRHELTHQLFQESRRSVNSPFSEEFLWLGEGIAMYFESLTDHSDYVTLGGFDSRRLQYARLRRVKEQYSVPLKELSELNLVEFQSQPDIAKIYSQSAGVADFLMNGEKGELRQPLVEFLRLSYQGRLKSGSFEKIIDRSFEQIDNDYAKFLRLRKGQLDELIAPELRTELCLNGYQLVQDDALAPLARCTSLQWLDLSRCDVHGDRLKYLKSCPKLRQLFLADAVINTPAVDIIVGLPLEEIDLSGTNLNDKHLLTIAKSETVKSLNVAGTKVTSEGLKTVSSSRPDIELKSNFNRDER